jgi:hypothetical protein
MNGFIQAQIERLFNLCLYQSMGICDFNDSTCNIKHVSKGVHQSTVGAFDIQCRERNVPRWCLGVFGDAAILV